jgi:hypothetical protein
LLRRNYNTLIVLACILGLVLIAVWLHYLLFS